MKSKKVEKPTFNNSSWNFNLDIVNTYAFWEKAFSKEECQTIINTAKNKGLIQGKTLNDEKAKDVRNSKISWIYPTDNMDWAFRRCTDIITNLNERFFKFDLYGFNEGFQFTNYEAPGGKYGCHIDKIMNGVIRKLSISVQLTNPSKYEGGELYLYEDDKGTVMNKEQGTLVVFPSYILHEVMPVTKGERNSLVSWITGPSFK